MPFSYITLLIRSAASREAQKEVETKIESFLPCFLIQFYVIHIHIETQF